MAEPFNPYRQWLELDIQGVPAHDYALLQLRAFESDTAKIAAAADRAIVRVRACIPGDRAAAWAQLLDELSLAKKRLTTPSEKAAYDEQLKARAAAKAAAKAAAQGTAAPVAPARPAPAATPRPAPAPAPPAVDDPRYPPGMKRAAAQPIVPGKAPAQPAPNPNKVAAAPTSSTASATRPSEPAKQVKQPAAAPKPAPAPAPASVPSAAAPKPAPQQGIPQEWLLPPKPGAAVAPAKSTPATPSAPVVFEPITEQPISPPSTPAIVSPTPLMPQPLPSAPLASQPFAADPQLPLDSIPFQPLPAEAQGLPQPAAPGPMPYDFGAPQGLPGAMPMQPLPGAGYGAPTMPTAGYPYPMGAPGAGPMPMGPAAGWPPSPQQPSSYGMPGFVPGMPGPSPVMQGQPMLPPYSNEWVPPGDPMSAVDPMAPMNPMAPSYGAGGYAPSGHGAPSYNTPGYGMPGYGGGQYPPGMMPNPTMHPGMTPAGMMPNAVPYGASAYSPQPMAYPGMAAEPTLLVDTEAPTKTRPMSKAGGRARRSSLVPMLAFSFVGLAAAGGGLGWAYYTGQLGGTTPPGGTTEQIAQLPSNTEAKPTPAPTPSPAPTPQPAPQPAPMPPPGEAMPGEGMTEPEMAMPAPMPAPMPPPEAMPAPAPTPEPAPPTPTPPAPVPTPTAVLPTKEQVAELGKALQATRDALTKGDMDVALTQIAIAEGLPKLPEHEALVDRLKLLTNYNEQFWHAVDEGIKSLKPGAELEVGSQRLLVVEATPKVLEVRIARMNKKFIVREMPAGVAGAVADLWFNKNDPAAGVMKGAYAAVNRAGDAEKAKELWDQAALSGVDVAGLLPVLEDKYDNLEQDLEKAMQTAMDKPSS